LSAAGAFKKNWTSLGKHTKAQTFTVRATEKERVAGQRDAWVRKRGRKKSQRAFLRGGRSVTTKKPFR